MRADRQARSGGFTLVELLVVMAVLGIALASMSSLFLGTSYQRRDSTVRVEVNQGLRVALDSIIRHVRLAGACLGSNLPGTNFFALDGVDSGTSDQITIRHGRLNPTTQSCLIGALAQDAAAGEDRVFLTDASGFADGMRLLLISLDGTAAQILDADAVNTSTGRIRFASGQTLDGDFATGASVFAILERTYALDTAALARPYLELSIDGNAPVPLADGVDQLDVTYVLDDTSGTVVDLPTAAQWPLVNEVLVTARLRLAIPASGGTGFYESTATLRGKPRNLIR